MLTGPFIPKSWMNSCESFDESSWVMVGIPYDGTCSFRPGTRFGPESARLASFGLESYSPYQDKDFEDIKFYDAGELDLPPGNRDATLSVIRQAAKETLGYGKKWLGIGGEHLVTYPVIQEYVQKYSDLAIVHFDAHADLRCNYLGENLSHATVIRRSVDLVGAENLIQIGIRSGTREEFNWIRENRTLIQSKDQIQEAFKSKPMFITIDLDVLDPSLMSGTGTPEPGGLTFNQLIDWLLEFKDCNIVGADILELSPHYDPTGVSTQTAAKVIREVLLLGA